MLISSLIWVCTVCPDLSVQKLRIITVVTVCPSILSPDTYFNFFFPGGNTCTLLCHSWANYGATMPPKRVHVICGPEPPKAKGPRLLASTNRRLFDLLQWWPACERAKTQISCTLTGLLRIQCFSMQWRLWSDLADVQADLSLRWAHIILLLLSCCGSYLFATTELHVPSKTF